MRAYARNIGYRALISQASPVRLVGLVIAALLAMSVFAGVAQASSVSNFTVNNTSPSAAAGAKTVYTVGFTTSPTGSLSAAANDRITIGFPGNTDLSNLVGSSVKVAGNNTSIGSCFHASGTQNVVCQLGTGETIGNTVAVTVEIDGVINPTTVNGAGSGFTTLSAFTTKDTDTSTSAQFQIQPVQSLSVTSVSDAPPSPAAGAKTVYTVGFTTSSTGALAAAAGSQITIGFPGNTDLSNLVGSSVKVAGNNTSIGSCFHASGTQNVVCQLGTGQTIGNTVAVTVEIDGIVNATSTGSNPITVDTTSDTSNSSTFNIASPQSLSVTSVSDAPPSPAAGAKTVYTVGFTTSSTGALAAAAGSQITIGFPGNTDLSNLVGSSVKVAGNNTSIGSCFHASGTQNVVCQLGTGQTIAPNTAVTIEIDGVINPTSTGSNPITVDTTSDTSNSSTFNIVAGQLVSQQTVTSSNSAAGATGVTYTVGFSTSSTGGLAATAGSQITIGFPTTTDLTHLTGSSVADTTVSNSSIGSCFHASGTENVVCQLGTGQSIGAGHQVRIIVNGVTNPTPASNALSVSTTSDTGLAGGGGGTGGGGSGGGNPPPPPPPTSPPAVTPSSPSTPSPTAAAVSGTVNPHGLATTVVFQYGLDLSQRGPGSSTTLYDQSTAPQQVGSSTSNQAVSANLTNLIAGGLYHVRMVATNTAGTTNGPDHTFTTPKAAPPPPPVLGKTQNAAPVSGKTFILVNGKFVPLTSVTKIPSGATIDALHGTLNLTSATGVGKKTQTGTFGGAVFKVAQARSGLTTLSLVNNAFKGAPSFAACATKKGKAVTAALSKKVLQLLHAKDKHGKFRSKGRYAAATTRGTAWSMADRCDGTLTSVSSGAVTVNDLVRHVNVTVRAHHSYLALAKPPKRG